MAFSIKNDEADRLVRELAAQTGESLTEAVTVALRERLERERLRAGPSLFDELMAAAQRFSALPVLDTRTDEEIIGYDEHGVPA